MNWATWLVWPTGRIPRLSFWLGLILAMAAAVALLSFAGPEWNWLAFLMLWPQICLNAKRLHDLGRSGWRQLIPVGINAILLIVAITLFTIGIVDGVSAARYNTHGVLLPYTLDDPAKKREGMYGLIAVGSLALSFLISVGYMLWLGLARGDAAANRYGPPPHG